MKKIYNLLLITALVSLSLVLSSCGSDEPKDSSERYFVKYELKTYSQNVFSTVDVEVTTEDGIKTMNVSRDWEAIFGPFKKGTTVSFIVKMPDGIYATTKFSGKISVSKNNDPFIYKAEDNVSGKTLSLSYTIDF